MLRGGLVVPVVTTGLHCGWPSAGSSIVIRLVVPVVTTGLHCGTRGARASAPVVASSPSSRRGSIAATRDSGPSSRPAYRGRPRRHDGAPLRPGRLGPWLLAIPWSSPSSRRGSIAAVRSSHVIPPVVCAVVPVVTTGLHCGVEAIVTAVAQAIPSSPSSRRGSIAADQ